MYYSRFLMINKSKRNLDKDEHVHHKDHNKLNDALSNLKIINNSEHFRYHNTGIKNGEAKLTEKDVMEIRDLSKKGCLQVYLAQVFNVSKTTIYRVIKNKLWRALNH